MQNFLFILLITKFYAGSFSPKLHLGFDYKGFDKDKNEEFREFLGYLYYF